MRYLHQFRYNKVDKVWYIFNRKPYTHKNENFINLTECEWAIELTQNWLEYQKELEYLIQNKANFIPYFNTLLGNQKSSWSTISLKTWGIKVTDVLKHVPKIKFFLEKYPGVTSMAISRLGPNSIIKRHQGDTDAIYRCHIGLSIPDQLPNCGFQVNNETIAWEEGKLIAFIDANEHEAWNNTEKERLILMFDVIRPEYLKKKTQICVNVRAFLLTQVFVLKYPILFKFPKPVLHFIFRCIKLVVWILLPYQKVFGVIRKHS